MDLNEILERAVEIMEEMQLDPVVIWTAACSVIAARDGITLDEASANLADLLENLTDEDDA
jgi:hypothetical protein